MTVSDPYSIQYGTNITWSLNFDGASTGITYATNYGVYYKMGPRIYVLGYVKLSSKGSATGAAAVDGLPSSMLDPGGIQYTASDIMSKNITLTSNYRLYLQGYPPSKTLSFFYQNNGTNNTQLTDTAFANNSEFWWQINYILKGN